MAGRESRSTVTNGNDFHDTMRVVLGRDEKNRDVIANVPMFLLRPFEDYARRNHDQTLDRLRERGGLSVAEAVAIITGRTFAEAVRMPNAYANDLFARLMTAMTYARLKAATSDGREAADVGS